MTFYTTATLENKKIHCMTVRSGRTGVDLLIHSVIVTSLGRVTRLHTEFYAENKRALLSNTFWLWPPGLQFLADVSRKCSSARQKPYAAEVRHSPRETSALHRMTSENKTLFWMCLRRRVSLSQGKRCSLFAPLASSLQRDLSHSPHLTTGGLQMRISCKSPG